MEKKGDFKEKAKIVSATAAMVATCAAGSVATKLISTHLPVPEGFLERVSTKVGIWAISLGIGKLAGKTVMDEVDSVMDILTPLVEGMGKNGNQVSPVDVEPCKPGKPEETEDAHESL